MALFRALSTRRSRRGGPGGYDKLLDETNNTDYGVNDADHVVLKRVTSVPASMLFGSSSKKVGYETGFPWMNSKPKQQQQQQQKQTVKSGNKKGGKSHPVFSLFDGKWRKKKMTANPDFS
ncbi:hypothetical protein SOVF_197970, partial [Spinacia oleracea]